MERVSLNMLVAPAVIAVLFLLSTTTATVVERMPKTLKGSPDVIIIEKVVVFEEPKTDHNNGNQKANMMIMQPNIRVLDKAQSIKQVETGDSLKCSPLAGYCNNQFGPECCAGNRCYDVPFAGGVCF